MRNNWVVATKPGGERIYVNLMLARTIYKGNSGTEISWGDSEAGSTTRVQESPEDLLDQLDRSAE
jgi:hypothetical protein